MTNKEELEVIAEQLFQKYCKIYNGADDYYLMDQKQFAKALGEIISLSVESPVILQLTETLKTNKIETDLEEYLADKQVYNNYGRSFMLPDDAEEVARYVGIFIRTMLVDIKSKLSK